MKTRTVVLFLSVLLSALSLHSRAAGQYSEHITLFTDRQIYISGERIWFKALCTGHEGISDPILSKILYLELYDQRLNSIVRLKFRITEGIATGFLDVPSDIHSGNYYLRAYTQFLRNYTAYQYATELIQVINPQKPLLIEESVPSDEVLIVEEGGMLLPGIPNKIAIRIPPALCKETVAMEITDADGHEYARSVPWPNGIALLEFTPGSRMSYTLKLVQHNGKEIIKPLPAISETGIIMRTEKTDGTWNIKLLTGPSDIKDDYTLEVRSPAFDSLSGNVIRPGESVKLQSGYLEHGMNYLLLRNKQNDIIQIRPVFENKIAPCESDPVLNKNIYEPREAVGLSIKSTLKPLVKNSYTISVSLKGTTMEQDDLLPYPVAYNPALFSNYIRNKGVINDSLMSQIEALCILYSQVLKPQDFSESPVQTANMQWLPEIRDAGLCGQIRDKRSRLPLQDIMVYASVIGGSNQVHIAKTTVDGKFYFSLNHLTGSQNIYMCARPVEGVPMELVINSDFSNAYPQSAGMIPFDPDSSQLNMLDRLYRNAQLNKMFQKYTTAELKDTLYYPLPETGAEKSVTLDDYIEMPVMSEVFSELVPFTSVKRKGDQFVLNVFDEQTLNTYEDPLVMLDGIPVFDLNQIMGISPELIQKIDVVNRMVFLGDQTIFGVIRLSTSTKNFAGMSFPEYSSFIEFQSLTPASYPEFPDHRMKGRDDRNPDFRTLLYWSPFMPDQATGDIPFFTSDDCATYEVILKLNDGLNSCTGKTTFRVERPE